jgi:LacI family transcriptional regulator
VAAQLDRSVLILSTRGRRDADALVTGLAARCDGLVVLGPTVDDEVVHRLNRRGTPIVLVARTPLADVDSVNAENNASGTLLGEHLVAAGARTILFVGDPDATADVTERFAAVKTAAERDGASVTVDPVADFSEEAGVHAARQALARRRTTKSLPDAFACANDELALGLMLGLRDAGLRVPEDAIVSGWDDVMAARYAGLTTVRQPMRDLGVHAAQLLDQLIHRTRETPVHEVLPTELIVRQSTTRITPPAGGTTR